MCTVMYRIMAIVLATVLVASSFMISIGLLSTGKIHIGYHENESDIYLSYVQDMSHGLRHQLAGTYCFQPLPSWAHTESYYGSPDFGQDFVRQVEPIDEMILIIDCKSAKANVMPNSY